MKTLLALAIASILPAVLFGQETSKPIRIFKGHTDKVTSVAVSPDGKQLISGSDDKTIRVWDIEKPEAVQVLKDHQNYVLSVAFSGDGKRFLSAGGGQWRGQTFATETDQFVRLWNTEEMKVLKKMPGHEAPIWSVAFAPDGKHALTGSGGYDTAGGKFTPAGFALKLWDLATGETVRDYKGHENWVRDAAFHPQGKILVSGGWDKTVRVWDIEKDQATQILRDHKDNVEAIAISSDGKWLLSGGGRPVGGDTAIRLWDLKEGKVVKRFAGHTRRVWKLTFAKDDQRFLSAAADKSIRLWDIAAGKEVHRFVGHTDEIRQAIFTPDGKHMVSASHDKTLRLWQLP
jgi:WD40 repeat protein